MDGMEDNSAAGIMDRMEDNSAVQLGVPSVAQDIPPQEDSSIIKTSINNEGSGVQSDNTNSDTTQLQPTNNETIDTASSSLKIFIESSETNKDMSIDKALNSPQISIESSEINKDMPIDKALNSSHILIENSTDNNIEISINDMDSENLSESGEKEHNKSISRELKSLINSAKESKIINEFTQVQTKMRHSRKDFLEGTSNSLNSSIEMDKIQNNRRSSTNSLKSNSSERSESASQKRSMRSQNPEFVSKHKKFLSSVTGVKRDVTDKYHSGTESDSGDEIKSNISKNESAKSPKNKKTPSDRPKRLQSDSYCWRCHWSTDQSTNEKPNSQPPRQCSVCPRSYHYKCISNSDRSNFSSEKNWVCPECINILHAENSETRSPAMKKISLGMLCDLLKYAIKRMMDVNGVEPFLNPVDRTAFPDYNRYIVNPMDLTLMSSNIAEGLYGSTDAFLADAQWILHNSIIFNTFQSKLTTAARTLVRSCRAEMSEIETCPECYAAAHARRPTWFTDVCSTPHIMLWAKLKGFPYWPAKGMSINNGMVDVRFFGAHDRAWVPIRDCYLYCENDPNNFRTKRQDILDSMKEADQYIRNISRKFGNFFYAPFKTLFDAGKMSEQLKIMIPGFSGEISSRKRLKDNVSNTSSPATKEKRQRSNSKSSILDGEPSDEDEPLASSQRKMADGAEIAREEEESNDKTDKDDSAEIDVVNNSIEIKKPNKRRRSQMEEAVITVMDSTAEKRKRLPSPEIIIMNNSLTEIQEKKSTIDGVEEMNTNNQISTSDKVKNIEKESPNAKVIESPIVKITTLLENKTADVSKNSTAIKAKPIESEIRTPKNKIDNNEDKSNKKRRNSKIKETLHAESKEKIVNITKENNNAKQAADKKVQPVKSFKDRIGFDDGASEVQTTKEKDLPPLPTISNIISLSTHTTSTDKNTHCITLEARNPNIFKTTNTGNVSNMKDAVAKLQKLRNEADKPPDNPQVGRIGVRNFAKMTSPNHKAVEANTQKNDVCIEVKEEPIEYEDPERTAEKLNLMQSFCLQPVSNLREVRINKVVANKIKANEVSSKARKTFPQPKKPEEGRSELNNSKNSMVYIPVQPTTTQAPTKSLISKSPTWVNGIVPDPQRNSVNMVNTVTTPLMTAVSMPSTTTALSPSLNTAPSITCVPTSVQTVPLITSVNGQWTLSLQPVMSVGTENPESAPLVNGITDRGIIPVPVTTGLTIPPNVSSTPTRTNDSNPLGEPPSLQQRPPLMNPFDPATPIGEVPTPSTAGPLTAKLNQNAVKLADFFRNLLEDSLEKLDDPASQVTTLKLQLEQLKWQHKQQIDELKYNHELTVAEMTATIEKEKLRLVSETRRTCQLELETAVNYVKSKQWCANCRQEAQFYCCWNTSYCDYPCQRAHWVQHYSACTQQRSKDNRPDGISVNERLQPPDVTSKTSVLTVGGKNVPPRHPAPRTYISHTAKTSTPSIIVSMATSSSGTPTIKCVGSYKPSSTQPSTQILNKQLMGPDDTAKTIMTPAGYLIVSGNAPNSSIVIN